MCGPVREIKRSYARQKQEELNKLRQHNQEYKDNGLGENLPDVLTAVSVDEPRPSRSDALLRIIEGISLADLSLSSFVTHRLYLI